ncbi:MAG: FHA domain-containing protein [Acaryochloridaceae cyanobacterium SU_2_1]|nr:FHA domain-containing protein [Acaryochloridaceae cyanobacterium SU_2_1]
MIVCPNCLYQNQDQAVTCEVCQTALPITSSCPNCGLPTQLGARFCGQCGFELLGNVVVSANIGRSVNRDLQPKKPESPAPAIPFYGLEPSPPDPLILIEPISGELSASKPSLAQEDQQFSYGQGQGTAVAPVQETQLQPEAKVQVPKTQLQVQSAKLLHAQSNAFIELPQHQTVIHIGKPNDRVPPDIDVAGFPNAEIVSRIHANIRVESGHHFIEDVGSSNGTYVNNVPLIPGNRHRLRIGDRIALGKGDLVTFLFQAT